MSVGMRGHARAAWERGAVGEALVGRMLDGLPGVRTLHDRAMPGGSANIDHLAIAPTGVYVIDAKHYTGEPRVDAIGGIRRLFVGRDDRMDLVAGARRQAMEVEAVLAGSGLPAHPVLCFVGSHWELTNGFVVDGVGVTSPDRLAALLRTPGPLDAAQADSIRVRLAHALAPA